MWCRNWARAKGRAARRKRGMKPSGPQCQVQGWKREPLRKKWEHKRARRARVMKMSVRSLADSRGAREVTGWTICGGDVLRKG